MNKKNYSHFQGKKALTHVIEARKKGKDIGQEEHGLALSGPLFSALDSAKETATLFTLLAIIFFPLKLFVPFVCFFFGYLAYKSGKTALIGWARLERLHRLIEEERYEIEHHREQEKEELIALYQAKGFSGKLLEEVIEVLMADDNRLLQVMLEDEFGLSLEEIEHPLQQALGTFLGVFGSGILIFSILYFFPSIYLLIPTSLLIIFCSWFASHKEKRNSLYAICWNLGLSYLCFSLAYFLRQTIVELF